MLKSKIAHKNQIAVIGTPRSDYSFRLRKIAPKEKIIIVDDLIATGGTSEAAAKLVEKCGGEIAGFIFVINLFDLGGKKLLEKKGYKTFSLIDFPGH